MVNDAVRQLEILSRAGGRWHVALDSSGRGVWQTTYGFVFSPNHDEDYFSEPTGDEEFTVVRKPRDSHSLTFLPTVFFTWLSSKQAFSNVQHGPTVGLGVTTGADGGRFAALGGVGSGSIRTSASSPVSPSTRTGVSTASITKARQSRRTSRAINLTTTRSA